MAFEGFNKLFGGETISFNQLIDMKKYKAFFKSVKTIAAKGLGQTLAVYDKNEKRIKKKKKTAAKGMGIALDVLGVFLQFMDKLGVLEPILQILNGIFDVIGGSIMTVLAPALAAFAEEMFDEEHMQMWKDLGLILGTIVVMGLKMLLIIINALAPSFKILLPVIVLIMKAIGFLIIGALFPLIMIIYVFGTVIALIMDVIGGIIAFFTGQPAPTFSRDWQAMMLPIIGSMLQGGAEIIMMATGGYIPPSSGGTLAIIGEGGEGEFVVPESKMPGVGGSDEVVWATQDNGDKLDKIIFLLGSQGRLR